MGSVNSCCGSSHEDIKWNSFHGIVVGSFWRVVMLETSMPGVLVNFETINPINDSRVR